MAKKKSPIDAALEVARKVRVPKKPVKAKGKKTVPSKLDWGPGIPEDKLAYLNDDEMALVQANRMFKGKRSFNGVPAFPDPKDTGAGDNSRLPDGGGGAGTGGRPGGGGGQPGSSSPGAGGASKGAAGGPGGQSSTSQTKDQSKPASPAGGPTGGPTSAPARTEPSRAATPPSSFGPRAGSMPGTPVSTAPATAAYEGALSRIAQGSSVIGSQTGPKIQDRVPQAQPTTVNFSQTPMSGPNRGLGGISPPKEDLTIGANSPFASPGLAGYNREAYSPTPTAAPAPSGILGPSVPVGTAGYTAEQIASKFPGAAAYNPALSTAKSVISANTPAPASPAMPSPAFAATDPRVAQTPAGAYPAAIPMDASFPGRALDAQTLGEQLAFASGAAANKIGSYIGSAAQNAGNYVSSLFGGEPATQTAATKTPAQEAAELQNLIAQQNAYPSLTPDKALTDAYNKMELSALREGVTRADKMQDRIPESAVSINPQTGLPVGEKIQDRLPGYGEAPLTSAANVPQTFEDVASSIGPSSISPLGTELTTPSVPPAASPPGKTRSATFSEDVPEPLSIPPSQVQTPVVTPTPYGPIVGTVEDPYNQRYAKAASYIGGIHPVDYGPTPAAIANAPTEVETPGYPGQQANMSPSQGYYSPSQAPAYDMSPSQQSGLTQAQRDEYLGSLGGSRQEPVRPIFPASPARGGGGGKKAPTQYLKPLPPWVDYSYLYTDYPEIGTPSPNISAFNDYTATMRRGGRVGDSVDAALRLARQPVVSRNKTR